MAYPFDTPDHSETEQPMIDVLIQAGHEGGIRNSGSGTKTTIGTPGEIWRTPQVADRAANVLQRAGFEVVREDALYDQVYDTKLAVSIHFDGTSRTCGSGASLGYPPGTPAGSNKPAANLWRDIYSEFWPFAWMPDNFTTGLEHYYGYAYTRTGIAELLIEMGELTCPEQKAWLDERIANGFLGDLVAYWASVALGDPIDKPIETIVQGWHKPGDPIDTETDAKAALAYQGSLNIAPTSPTDNEWIFRGRVADLFMQHDQRIR